MSALKILILKLMGKSPIKNITSLLQFFIIDLRSESDMLFMYRLYYNIFFWDPYVFYQNNSFKQYNIIQIYIVIAKKCYKNNKSV